MRLKPPNLLRQKLKAAFLVCGNVGYGNAANDFAFPILSKEVCEKSSLPYLRIVNPRIVNGR